MDNIFYDEKICESIHLTLGNAYKQADNGNKSQYTLGYDINSEVGIR